jgi:hypothetical protein
MKNLIWLVVAIMGAILVFGCASAPKPTPPVKENLQPASEPGEKMIWASHNPPPSWRYSIPEDKDGNLFFFGISGNFATEQLGRDDAQRNAITEVTKYIGTSVKDKLERIVTSYGLSKEVVDSTIASRRIEEQFSSAFVTRVKTKELYIEKWEVTKTKETYYKVYVFAYVPRSAIDKSYEETLDGQIDDLKKKRDEANDEKAKTQYDNAMKAFEDAKKQGFSLGKEEKKEEKKPE